MDTQSCTGATLSWSPSTNPLTDDSACGLTKQEPAGKPTGGNAVGALAASCPIDRNAAPPVSRKHSRDRPLFSSSEEEMEERGKGVGRETPRLSPITRKASRTPSQRRSPTPSKRERSPRRPTTPDGQQGRREGRPHDGGGGSKTRTVPEKGAITTSQLLISGRAEGTIPGKQRKGLAREDGLPRGRHST